MNLDIHMIDAKPSAQDPLGQRAYAALVWGPENELIELPGGMEREEAAAHVALTVAADIMRKIVPQLQGSQIADALTARIERDGAESERRNSATP